MGVVEPTPAVAAAVSKLQKYCYLVFQMIDGQTTSYLGKVNYLYVKILAKQRKQVIEDVLSATCNYFPSAEIANHTFLMQVATILEAFFLTDHVVLDDDEQITTGSSEKDIMAPSSHDKHHHHRDLSHISLDNLNPLAWIKGAGFSPPSSTRSTKELDNPSTPIAPPLQPTSTSSIMTPMSSILSMGKKPTVTVVVPLTRRSRKSIVQRDIEDAQLKEIGTEAMLLVDDDRTQPAVTGLLPNYSRPVPTVQMGVTRVGQWLDANPWMFALIAAGILAILQKAAASTVTMDSDLFLLCIFASFCLGLHTPRPMVGGFDRPPTMKGAVARHTLDTTLSDKSGRKLLQRSMIVGSPMAAIRRASIVQASGNKAAIDAAAGITGLSARTVQAVAAIEDHLVAGVLGIVEEAQNETEHGMSSPMALFPEDAEIGSHFNCWSMPESSEFQVRGPNYLSDKKKVPSDEYIFPCRGVDLFLTDACPQNVGKNPGVMGGRLRDVPSFIINFRLPWGVLLVYCEIPPKFVPFLEASTAGDAAQKELMPALAEMSPPERTTARWLMGDNEYKNQTLKIVPVVVEGPWVVKTVVGGKPALIGAKLPIDYVYQPGDGKEALYLEADLDIAASSAARSILSVARSYTQVLTINLGFVIQGNLEDELPEQMLTGARLHGIDPLTAPCFPPSGDELTQQLAAAMEDEESV